MIFRIKKSEIGRILVLKYVIVGGGWNIGYKDKGSIECRYVYSSGYFWGCNVRIIYL